MKTRVRHRHSIRRQLVLSALFGILAAVLVIGWFDRQMRPVLISIAKSRLDGIVTGQVSAVAAQVFEEDGIEYSDLISFETDDTGQITALKGDVARVNLLRDRIVQQLSEQLALAENMSFSIPSGSLLRTGLFAGKGIQIPVQVCAVNCLAVEFEGEFSDSGINQTRYEMRLKVQAELEILLPGGVATAVVYTQVPVADAVLLGQVPESYTFFSDTATAEDAAENYFNFS